IIRRLTTDLPSIERFGEYWTWMLMRGMRDLPLLNADQYMEVRYEDLMSAPSEVLERIARFFALGPHPQWLQRATSRVDPEAAPDRLLSLEPEVRSALERACRPGQVLLGREQADGLDPTIRRFREIWPDD